ncbi:sensor domain-containing diguanylate cyclase [Alcaligenaceae bacterium A4P071]|nr:sensor domain-containing diguanylate cyclase [Alcaligenaceae bacterium A4P071]
MTAVAIVVLLCALVVLGVFFKRERNRTQELLQRHESLRAHFDLYETIAHQSSDIVALTTATGHWVFVSPSIENVLGWTPDDLKEKRWQDLVHPDDLLLLRSDDDTTAMVPNVPVIHENRFKHKDGHWIWMESYTTQVPHPANGQPSLLSKARDITQRKTVEIAQALANAKLAEQASIDSLTGLFNRRHLLMAFDREYSRALRTSRPICLLLVDADHFKPLNDHYGHQAGDLCLTRISDQIMRSLLRPGDLVGRYGGEEFIVLLPETDAAGMLHVAEKIRRNVEDLRHEHILSPFKVATVSVGAVYIPAGLREDRETLIGYADEALYQAKRLGRNRVICRYLENGPLPREHITLPAHGQHG